jgi:hypothetical protein
MITEVSLQLALREKLAMMGRIAKKIQVPQRIILSV